MKKNLLLVIAGAVALSMIASFSLFGCQAEPEVIVETVVETVTETVTETVEVEKEAGEEEMEPLTVGYSNGLITHAWRTQMMADIQQDFNLYKGMGWCDELIIQNAGFDVDLQINQIRNLINSGVDLLLINPNSVTALNPVIEEADDAGVMVMIVDQTVDSEVPYQLLGNSYQWMADQAKWVFEKMGGEGNVVYLSGVDGQPANTDRDMGFEDTLAEYPDIEYLTKAMGNWDPAAAQQAMSDVLAAFSDIDAVVSHDGQVMGTLRAFDAAGREFPMTNGDYMVNYVEYWVENIDTIEAFTLVNSPGWGTNFGLGVGLRMLRGWEIQDGFFAPDELHGINSPTVALIDYTTTIDNSNAADRYQHHINTRGTAEYIDIWPAQEEIDSYFK